MSWNLLSWIFRKKGKGSQRGKGKVHPLYNVKDSAISVGDGRKVRYTRKRRKTRQRRRRDNKTRKTRK